MERYQYFALDKAWNPSCLSRPRVVEAIELVRRLYGVASATSGAWACIGKPNPAEKREKKVAGIMMRSQPTHLTYYVILNDSRFTALLLYRMLCELFPSKSFVIAEGRPIRSVTRRYFCVELMPQSQSQPTLGTTSDVAYDMTYYFPALYRRAMDMSDGHGGRGGRGAGSEREWSVLGYAYESVRYFEEAEYVKHIAWRACGVELFKPYRQTIIIREADLADDTVIDFKRRGNADERFMLLYRYWLGCRPVTPATTHISEPTKGGSIEQSAAATAAAAAAATAAATAVTAESRVAEDVFEADKSTRRDGWSVGRSWADMLEPNDAGSNDVEDWRGERVGGGHWSATEPAQPITPPSLVLAQPPVALGADETMPAQPVLTAQPLQPLPPLQPAQPAMETPQRQSPGSNQIVINLPIAMAQPSAVAQPSAMAQPSAVAQPAMQQM